FITYDACRQYQLKSLRYNFYQIENSYLSQHIFSLISPIKYVMNFHQDLKDENSFKPFWHVQKKMSQKTVEKITSLETSTVVSAWRPEKIWVRNVEFTTVQASAPQPTYLNGALIGVTVVAGIIFFLVAALLIYVVIHAKSSSRQSTTDEDDDVFEEDEIIPVRKKRSLPVIRFDVESDKHFPNQAAPPLETNLPALTQRLTHCIINIVQLTHLNDYRRIETPFLLRTYIEHNKGVYKPPVGLLEHVHVFKERNLRCVVHIFKVQELASQELGIEFPSWELKSAWNQHVLMEITVSNLVILIGQNSKMTDELNHLLTEILRKSLYVPVFILFPEVRPTHSQYLGYSVCLHRKKCLKVFECSEEDCLESIWGKLKEMTNIGKQIFWRRSIFDVGGPNMWTISGTPLQHRNPWKLFDSLFSFLTVDLDRNVSQIHYTYANFVLVVFIGQAGRFGQGFTEFRVSHTPGFNFITTDSVYSTSFELTLYINPFDPTIWLCIGLTILSIVLIILSGSLFLGDRNAEGSFIITLKLWGHLLEQGGFIINPNTKISKSQFVTVISVIWILTAVVLSNGYKAFLKTVFVTQNELLTKWSSLEELRNFTFVLPMNIDVTEFNHDSKTSKNFFSKPRLKRTVNLVRNSNQNQNLNLIQNPSVMGSILTPGTSRFPDNVILPPYGNPQLDECMYECDISYNQVRYGKRLSSAGLRSSSVIVGVGWGSWQKVSLGLESVLVSDVGDG
ncbi:unnamed protein product, partial [Allacma fusca]